MKYKVFPIKKEETYDWVLNKHYLKRIPPISYAFGLYDGNDLIGICTFGVPASNSLCMGICGKEYEDIVLELNRLCVNEDREQNSLSYFVSKCLKLIDKPKIIVSYADTSWGHNGYIYQATNWIYTGLSAKRTDCKIIGEENNGRHSRHIFDKYGGIEAIKKENPNMVHWVDRSRKHRYLYIIANRKEKNKMIQALNYEIKPYPKGDNDRYDATYTPNTQRILL